MRLGAVVLAGGGSRRMGQDKAAVVFDGATLLARVVSVLTPLVEEVVVAAATAGAYEIAGARTVADLYPGEGPVGGVLSGLAALGDGFHLVVACDMPLVAPGLLRYFQTCAMSDLDVVVPVVAGAPEPLCALYSSSAVDALTEYLRSGGRSARGALASLRRREVEEAVLRRIDPDLRSFMNVNTPAELTALTGSTG